MDLKKKSSSLCLLFLLWAVIITVLFGGYELIERFWIDPENMKLIHILHILRGIGASVLTALLVGIYLVKWRPSPSILGGPLSYLPTPHVEIIRRQAVWFVHMRWAAIVLAFLAVVYSTQLSSILPQENFFPLLGCLIILLLANISFAYLTPRSKKPYRLLMMQTVVDLSVLTFLLHFSGGIENPFFLIYIFHVIMAGILLTRRDAALITVLTCVLFVGLAGGEFFQLISHSYIGLFPHGPLHTDHAALDLSFVAGRSLPFVLVLCFTAYFTILPQDQIREDQRHVVQAGKFAAIGELAGRIAHEINNPAGIISTKVQLLLEEKNLPLKVALGLEKIDKHNRRIAELTGGLLTFSRPSLGEKSQIDLNEAVESSLSLVEWGEATGVIRIEKTLEQSLSPMKGNTHEIQEIILNLINNALDAMPQGGTLSVQTRQEGKDLLLIVSDTGVGIPKRIINRIFDPFFTSKENGKGTGLGLSIVDGLVRSHEGWIEVQSLDEKGASFQIHFPTSSGKEPADA